MNFSEEEENGEGEVFESLVDHFASIKHLVHTITPQHEDNDEALDKSELQIPK